MYSAHLHTLHRTHIVSHNTTHNYDESTADSLNSLTFSHSLVYHHYSLLPILHPLPLFLSLSYYYSNIYFHDQSHQSRQ